MNLLKYPTAVNESASRIVAGAVAIQSLAFLIHPNIVVSMVLMYGFIARTLSPSHFSPLARLANRYSRGNRYVSGPPKRFAALIGAVLSTGVFVSYMGEHTTMAIALSAALFVASTLEFAFAYCIGCTAFFGLMTMGLIPKTVCDRCNNIWGN